MPRPTAFFAIATFSFIALCVSTVLLLCYRHHRPAYSPRVFEEYLPTSLRAAAAGNNNGEEMNNKRTSSSSSIQQEYVDYTIHRRQLTVDVEPRIIISDDDHQHSSSTRRLGPVINRVLSYFKYRLDIDERRMAPQCRSHSSNHSSSSFFLLMAYVSAPDNFQQRQLIRQSWADHRRHNNSSSRRQHQMIFVIGRSQSPMTEWRLTNESVVYGDVVQVSNVIDSYANLTLKSVALLHWALTRCPGAQFVVKSDDDNYVNVELLLSRHTLTSFASSLSAAIYGTTNAVLWPARDLGHRHYVSRELWPWPRYPSYLMGGAYLISGGSSTLRRLLAAVQTTPFFPLEDAYIIGLCAPRVDIAIRYTSR